MRDKSKTCLATVLIRLILRWKNCPRAEALVQFSSAKIERINTVAGHVLLQNFHSVKIARLISIQHG